MMKTIFKETKTLGSWDFPEVRTVKRECQDEDGFGGYDTRVAPYVFRFKPEPICASVEAKWDKATGVLFVLCQASCADDAGYWLLSDEETLERNPSRESVLRRVIEIADRWYADVRTTIPAKKSDAELLAEYVPEEGAVELHHSPARSHGGGTEKEMEDGRGCRP